jgi:hypothetical protein
MDKQQSSIDQLHFLQNLADNYKRFISSDKYQSGGQYFAENALKFLGCVKELSAETYHDDVFLPKGEDHEISVSQVSSELYTSMLKHFSKVARHWPTTERINFYALQMMADGKHI